MNVSIVSRPHVPNLWKRAATFLVLRFTWLLPEVSPIQIHVMSYVLTLREWGVLTGNSKKRTTNASCTIHQKEHVTSSVVQRNQTWSLA